MTLDSLNRKIEEQNVEIEQMKIAVHNATNMMKAVYAYLIDNKEYLDALVQEKRNQKSVLSKEASDAYNQAKE